MSETNIQGRTVAENLRYLLLQSIGRMVVADFWFGGPEVARRCGVLTAVGTDYLLLTDDVNQIEIAGDLGALRLVTICQSAAEATDGATDQADAAENADASDTAPLNPNPSVSPVAARPHAQAAFNYAKRKTRKLE